MVWVTVILLFTSISSSQSWNIAQQMDKPTVKDAGTDGKSKYKILDKFPDTKEIMTCDMFYKPEETPFVAIIVYKTSGRLLCMGSIVDNHHILTSKRCYNKIDPSELLVIVGYRKAWWGRYAQIVKVKKILRHEYELAMLRLKQKIRYTDYVQAVKLPGSTTQKITEFEKKFPGPYLVAGFFVDRFDVPGDYIPKNKVYSLVQDALKGFDDCKKNFSSLILEKERMFCTMGNATYCWGGWGGPILKSYQQLSTSYFVQVGVVVHNNCTADTIGPLLAIRTDVYGDWIKGNAFQGHEPT